MPFVYGRAGIGGRSRHHTLSISPLWENIFLMVRMTARSRLAILYTALVFGAGVVLVALTYVLVRQSMRHRFVYLSRGPADISPPPDPAAQHSAERLREETIAQLLTQSVIALTVVTVLAAVLGWLVAGRLLRPIRAISSTAQRLSAEHLAERVPVNPPADELSALAGTINGMLDRIESGMADRDRLLAGQRMFVANVAHELRTPLATMRTALDVTLDATLDGRPGREELLEMAADIDRAVTRSQRTLDGLLALARSQAGPARHSRLDLAEVFGAGLDAVRGQAAASGIALSSELAPAPISGEPVLIERMAGNLIDNALRYNDSGGSITVVTGVAGGRAFARVTNTGQRVARDEVDRLFEPFVRAGTPRSRTSDGGVGLGLSIVRAIALAHDGEISHTAPEQGGLELTIRFAGRSSEGARI
jgi:signal transduction histidine kinase